MSSSLLWFWDVFRDGLKPQKRGVADLLWRNLRPLQLPSTLPAPLCCEFGVLWSLSTGAMGVVWYHCGVSNMIIKSSMYWFCSCGFIWMIHISNIIMFIDVYRYIWMFIIQIINIYCIYIYISIFTYIVCIYIYTLSKCFQESRLGRFKKLLPMIWTLFRSPVATRPDLEFQRQKRYEPRGKSFLHPSDGYINKYVKH